MMRFALRSALTAAIVSFAMTTIGAQDAARVVAGGGITVPGWTGKIDAQEEKAGQALNNAKLAKDGKGLHVTTGPAVTYWNPANKATGNYTVKATFNEPKYMNLNDHPHPYGIVIAGNDLGTPTAELSLLRGLRQRHVHRPRLRPGAVPGERPRGEPNAAVHKAAGKDQPVTQEIASVGEGRQGRVLDQRHRRRQLRQGRRSSTPAS